MSKHFDITWGQRSAGPAMQPPDDAYPYGIALDCTEGRLPACMAKLPYPAPGVGSWIVVCKRCGYTAAVTAAGRADDPTQIIIPCKATA